MLGGIDPRECGTKHLPIHGYDRDAGWVESQIGEFRAVAEAHTLADRV